MWTCHHEVGLGFICVVGLRIVDSVCICDILVWVIVLARVIPVREGKSVLSVARRGEGRGENIRCL